MGVFSYINDLLRIGDIMVTVRVVRGFKWVPRRWFPFLSRKETVRVIDHRIDIVIQDINDASTVDKNMERVGYKLGRGEYWEYRKIRPIFLYL